jgi:DnaJ-class molecular chaperone
MNSYACPDCGTVEGNCSRCHGSGKILSERHFGESAAEMPCPRCKGSGACPSCEGTGIIEVGGEG